MKKLIKDELNIRDIMYSVDLNELLYGDFEDSDVDNPAGNVFSITYSTASAPTELDLAELIGQANYHEADYIVLAINTEAKKVIFKKIPMR